MTTLLGTRGEQQVGVLGGRSDSAAFIITARVRRQPAEGHRRPLRPGLHPAQPDAQDGPEAFTAFVSWLRGEYPNLRLDIKRVIAEGDMVVTHSHLDLEPSNPSNPRRALADFFRLENGKVVEHWDIIQDIPIEAANNNGMF